MDEQAFQFDIQPAEASQLDMLEHTFDPDSLSKYHQGSPSLCVIGKKW